MNATYIGHSTVLIEIDGLRLLTDPLLKSQVAHLRRKNPIPEFDLSSIDAVLISHNHLDHFHLPSLQSLNNRTKMICPVGSDQRLVRNGFSDVNALNVKEAIEVGHVQIRAVRAEHFNLRIPLIPDSLCVGYVIEGSNRIYFAGDTDVFPEMAEFSTDLDLALLPVWGWGPNLGSGHMDPYRAALALNYLKPRMAIPIHWGTYYPIGLGWFRKYLLVEPPKLFQRFAEKMAPDVSVQILDVGGSVSH